MTNEKETYNHHKPESELSKIRKENNFQVPEKYFDELPLIIQERVGREKPLFNISNIIKFFTKPYRAVAVGSIVTIIMIGLFLFTNQEQNNSQTSFDISYEELIQVYPEVIEYMDDQVLIEFAAAWMDQEELYYFDYEFGFDSVSFQNELFPILSDDEISEILYNL